MTDYTELANRLRKRGERINKFGSPFFTEANANDMIAAADAIEELTNTNVGKWIPVTERLPLYGDWVLGIGPKKGYYVCEYRGITHFPYDGDSPWFSAKGRSLTITHWMPLPTPPKEGTE